jgi:hypothetical protein
VNLKMVLNLMNTSSRSLLILAYLIGIVTVIGIFSFSYYKFGHDGLPIGWDTPHYIAQIKSICSEGVTYFVAEEGYYNIGYACLAYIFTVIGFSPVLIEVFLPVVLCCCIVVISGHIAWKYLKNTEIAIYTTLLASGWFALYRLGADLHPNLLAVTLLLAALDFSLPKINKNLTFRIGDYSFFIILFISSFIHIEITLFFSFVLFVTLFIYIFKLPNHRLLNLTKSFFLLGAVLGPGIILYINRIWILWRQSTGNLVFFPPLKLEFWINYLGILFPFAVAGMYFFFYESPDKSKQLSSKLTDYTIFLVWGITSIL